MLVVLLVLFEALCCHPLDTIKVRMQLYRKSGQKPPGFIKTGINIVQKEGFLSLYKGLGAVVIGIVPKMAIRFSSYEFYRSFSTTKMVKSLQVRPSLLVLVLV